MAAEALAAERIEQEIRLGNSECIEASEKSALAIRGASRFGPNEPTGRRLPE